MKTDAQGAGSLGDMQKQKCVMTLYCTAVCGSAEIIDGWTLTTCYIPFCSSDLIHSTDSDLLPNPIFSFTYFVIYDYPHIFLFVISYFTSTTSIYPGPRLDARCPHLTSI